MKSAKNQKISKEEKPVSKPEDKIWHEWFDNLTPKEHDAMLSKLGITKEDKKGLEKELKEEEE